MKVSIKFVVASTLFFAVPAFATPEDCTFCKKDHKSICESECIDESSPYGKGEACQSKCITSKCKTACEDSVKPGDKKSDNGKGTSTTPAPKSGTAKQ